MALGGKSIAGVARFAFESTGVGELTRDIETVERKYRSSTGELSDSAIKVELAQRRLQRALKDGPGAFDRQARAELNLRRAERELRQETDQLTAAQRRQTATAGRFQSRVSGLTGGLAGLRGGVGALGLSMLGSGGLVYALTRSLTVASNVEEQLSKTRRVFGDASSGVEEFASTSSRSFQIAQDQALETVSTLGALLQPLGIVGAKSADIAIELTKRGADLASFYNTDVRSALEAVRSGVVGESEPLRRYGALLSETRVKALALAETGKTQASALTDQEKALARISLILKDTSKVQGDAAKTGGAYAGQTRRLNAQLRDLEGNIGKLALPAVTDLVAMMNQGVGAANRFASALGGIGNVDIPGSDSDVWDLTKGIYSRIGPWGTVRNTRDLIRHIRAQGSLSSSDFAQLRQAARQGRLSGAQLEEFRQFMSDEQFAVLHRLVLSATRGRQGAESAPRGEGRPTPRRARNVTRPDPRTLLDIQLDLSRAQQTPGTADDLRFAKEERDRYQRQVDALERRKNLTAKQKAALSALYGQLASSQSAIDSIVSENEQKIAAQREDAKQRAAGAREAAQERIRDRLTAREETLANQQAAAELTKRLSDDRKAISARIAFYREQSKNQELLAAERRDYVGKRIAAQKELGDLAEKEAAAVEKARQREFDAFERRTRARDLRSNRGRDPLSGFGGGLGSALTEARRGRGKGADGGGLTEADVRRMHFDFLGSLQGVMNQAAGNLLPASGPSPDAFQTVNELRLLNSTVASLASSTRQPGTRYARTEFSALFDGATY